MRALTAIIACVFSAAVAMPSFASAPTCGRAPAPPVKAEIKIDPTVFFQRLVDRYRGLYLYRDMVSVVQVTQREGAETSRVETKITCEVNDGQLKVQTPGSQARQSLGLDLPMKQAPSVTEAKKKYDLWLAPHMTLKFTEQPLKEMRAGVEEGFTATEAEPVTIDNKKMIHVELRSASGGDGLSQHSAAKVDLYVNSDSMLIERIESEQRLPDGASYSTTLQITPEEAEGDVPVNTEAEFSPNAPTDG